MKTDRSNQDETMIGRYDIPAGLSSPSKGITVRKALASDAPIIGNLVKEFASYLRSLGDQSELNMTAETYLRDGFGPRPAFEGLVAEDHGTVVGYLLYHFGYDSDGAFRNLHIVDLYVDSRVRRTGAGRLLMAGAAKIAREADAREMIWSVYHTNELAITFYERLGANRISDLYFMKILADQA